MGAEDADREADAGPVGSEELAELLADRRRRYALYGLFVRSRRMDLPDLAELVTAWEHDRRPAEIPRERLRVYTALYHDHVPALEEAGLVRYSQPADALELTAEAGALADRIRRLAAEELGVEVEAGESGASGAGADDGVGPGADEDVRGDPA